MQKTLFPLLAGIGLTGCSAVVTTENADTFESWELCVLLYEPTSIYSDWVSIDEENATIRNELVGRGIITRQQCTVDALANKKCLEYGFERGTNDFAKCLMETEQHIAEMKVAKKTAHNAETAASAQQSTNLIILQQQQQVVSPPPTPTFNW